jgi:HSP20 family molecular chaperone IbpA
MDDKVRIMPCACFSHEDQGGRLRIDISLEMRKDSFCVSAPRGQDTEYSGCFNLAHEVVPEETEAKYESGLLRIFAPIRDWDRKVNVPIQ